LTMIKIFRAASLILSLAIPHAAGHADTLTIESSVIALHSEQADIQTVGKLTYQGGLVLSSSDGNFGGFSSLDISPDGKTLVSYSDRGYRLQADLNYDSDGNLTNLSQSALEPVYGLDESILDKKKNRDAEAMAHLPDGSEIVAFERNHRLLKYALDSKTPTLITAPEGLTNAPYNEGIEALTQLPDGRIFALTQGMGDDDTRTGWIGTSDRWDALQYSFEDGYEPSGATALPSGDILILERRYRYVSGVAIRIRYISINDLNAATPETILNGALIAELTPPFNIDNMEGIDAISDSDGTIFIYLISDDNFDPDDQKTLLHMFSLESDF